MSFKMRAAALMKLENLATSKVLTSSALQIERRSAAFVAPMSPSKT